MATQALPKPAERRRREQAAAVRRAILDATEALLVRDGYQAFSMRRLANRCGYTAPTIYHHFGDKRGLLDALLEERFGSMVQRIRAVPRHTDPVDTLRAQLAAFVDFGLENPTPYRLFVEPRHDRDAPPPEAAQQARTLIEATLARLAEQGRLLVDEIEEAVQTIWVMLHGLISTRISDPDYAWVENQVDISLETLLRGLVAPPGPRRGNGDVR